MPHDHIAITGETTLEAILEDLPGSRDVLVQHFGPGVLMPGQTWTSESLAQACRIRGVDAAKLLEDLEKLAK